MQYKSGLGKVCTLRTISKSHVRILPRVKLYLVAAFSVIIVKNATNRLLLDINGQIREFLVIIQ
jgi:hypothetical protein